MEKIRLNSLRIRSEVVMLCGMAAQNGTKWKQNVNKMEQNGNKMERQRLN